MCYRISITYIVYHIRNGIVSIMWYLLPNMFFSRKSHLYRYMFFRVPIGVGSYQFDIQTLRFPSKPSICLFFMLLLLFIVISLELNGSRRFTCKVIPCGIWAGSVQDAFSSCILIKRKLDKIPKQTWH